MLFKSTDRFPGRLLKHLAAMGVIQEAGPDQYRRTGFTVSLCMEQYSDAFPLMYASTCTLTRRSTTNMVI